MGTPDSLAERVDKMTVNPGVSPLADLKQRAADMSEAPHKMVPKTEAAKQQDEAIVRADSADPK